MSSRAPGSNQAGQADLLRRLGGRNGRRGFRAVHSHITIKDMSRAAATYPIFEQARRRCSLSIGNKSAGVCGDCAFQRSAFFDGREWSLPVVTMPHVASVYQ